MTGHRSCIALCWMLLLATGCDQGITCPAWSFPAVSVRVASAGEASPILGARGEVRDGAYRDSLFGLGDGYYEAAANRAGTYAVHVESEGYAAWDTTGVRAIATGGACATVETERIEARLAPAGSP